ncbi:metallophosphoesterase family protein [Schleiferilactobacillus shenzhenensis]|uniref:Calcineurin-like phosphoesterase domain-containing protein n=1 Tax=Schleiferilactobacillus shenzhenensis LY-73 TaxID=1231336 RepID=U4TLP5_9LACO|nr:DNA repair exonuclease [Schleiferilactobacillus shenzhenensis]ERL65796.1 hypothetical protein L248_1872 [Schleiferilactobacillus shenzhenensis LY-73]
MTRIVQMSDVHLGFDYAGLKNSQKSNQRKSELKKTFFDAVQYTVSHHADLLLIPGDLFDNAYPDETLVRDVQDTLARISPIPVMIAAGNHDFSYPGSFYEATTHWPKNVHIFSGEWSSIRFPELHTTVWGASFTAPYQHETLLKPVTAEDGDDLQIGVLHGDASTPETSPYDPITREQIAGSGLDWLALGHIHKRSEAAAGKTTYAYAGTPEGHGFDELGEKGILQVDFTEDHQPQATFIPTCQRRYEDVTVDISQAESNLQAVDVINDQLASQYGPQFADNLYKIHLVGTLSEDALITVKGISDQLTLFDRRISDETRADIDYDQLAQLDTLEGNYVQKMQAKISGAQDDHQRSRLETALAIGVRAFRGDIDNGN